MVALTLISPFDYSVKDPDNPPPMICPNTDEARLLFTSLRPQATPKEDYTCSETRPCSNG